MAYVISDECVSCGACAAQCPAEAISEGDAHFEINPDACLDPTPFDKCFRLDMLYSVYMN